MRSSWFCFSRLRLMSSRWLVSCLSCFSEVRSELSCWFWAFRSFWVRLRFWVSCSIFSVRFLTWGRRWRGF